MKHRVKDFAYYLLAAFLVCLPLLVHTHSVSGSPKPFPVMEWQSQVQTTPDCQFFFTFTATGALPSGNGFDQRQQGCNVWSITYFNSGFSAVDVTFQSAANNAGVPGTWGTGFPIQQSIVTGSNPASNTTGGFLWIKGQNAFTRVQLTSKTGTGVVTGSAFGWRIPSAQ